jgi:hypothetical protein
VGVAVPGGVAVGRRGAWVAVGPAICNWLRDVGEAAAVGWTTTTYT